MRCGELKLNIAGYLDDGIESHDTISRLESHLAACPLCRQEVDDHRELRNTLRSMPRPEIPQGLLASLRESVAAELAGTETRTGLFLPIARPASYRTWVMSYSVGAFASIFLGSTFLWLILSSNSVRRPGEYADYNARRQQAILLADREPQDGAHVSPFEYARERASVAAQSPSVNPRGTLVELTQALVNGDLKDDEVVVVADVYGNGVAEITEVVEPSRDKNAVDELARALDDDTVNSPFLPATFDQRSEIVRVVLKIQSVDVNIKQRPRRRGRVSL